MEQTMRLELGPVHWYFSYEEQNGANNETWVRSKMEQTMRLELGPMHSMQWTQKMY